MVGKWNPTPHHAAHRERASAGRLHGNIAATVRRELNGDGPIPALSGSPHGAAPADAKESGLSTITLSVRALPARFKPAQDHTLVKQRSRGSGSAQVFLGKKNGPSRP